MSRNNSARASWIGRHRLRLALVLAPLLLALGFCVGSLWNTITPAGIVIHHSAVPPWQGGLEVDAAAIDAMHRRRGFGIFYWGRVYHIGYHYVILPDGTVEQGRPDRCRGAHAAGYNSYIGVCLVGNFSSEKSASGASPAEEPTAAQLSALTEICRRLRIEYRIPARNVVTHREVNAETECPGDSFPFQKVAESVGKVGE